MIRTAAFCFACTCIGAAVLSACASAPLHYFTLVTPDATGMATVTPDAQNGKSSALPFEVMPVSVPAQVDQPQLVVRDGAQRVLLLNGERWIAPLSDELRSALAADLVRELHTQDATGLPDNDAPRLRIKLDVRHFDSWPGSYALLAGSWSVRVLHARDRQTRQDRVVTCASTLREPVDAGYAALVQGHQRAVAALAAEMAAVARALSSGQPAACPAA